MFVKHLMYNVIRPSVVQKSTVCRTFTSCSKLPKHAIFHATKPLQIVLGPTIFPYSSSQNEDVKNKIKHNENTLTRAQKLKKAVAEYGSTVIVFHVTISLISLGSCYFLVSSGLDLSQILENIGVEKWVQSSPALVSNAGTFAVAYTVHKVFAPIRISVTLASVPFIVRYLRHRGILKK